MTSAKKREVLQFAPDVPVEVALKYALHGRIVSTQTGERVLYTLTDDRVMFHDLDVAKKIEELGVNVRERFFHCRPSDGKENAQWRVWVSPDTQQARAELEGRQTTEAPRASQLPAEETPLERHLRESTKPAAWGEAGVENFAVFSGTRASAGTPAPVHTDAQKGHPASNNSNGTANGTSGTNANGKGPAKHPELQPTWAESLLGQANALVDVYAAALNSASTKYGNQVKPEDVRSLLVTLFIQHSRVASYGA
jgi:hypothetical protein